MTKSTCPLCFDTGCQCGGIGMSCHGCCTCEKGDEARKRREVVLDEVAVFMGLPKGTIVDWDEYSGDPQ